MLIKAIIQLEISIVVESQSSRNSMFHIVDVTKVQCLQKLPPASFSTEEAQFRRSLIDEFPLHTSLGDTYLPQHTFIQSRQDYVGEKIKGQGTILRYIKSLEIPNFKLRASPYHQHASHSTISTLAILLLYKVLR